jgi:hypothetical protein
MNSADTTVQGCGREELLEYLASPAGSNPFYLGGSAVAGPAWLTVSYTIHYELTCSIWCEQILQEERREGGTAAQGQNRRGVVGTGYPGAIGRAQCKKVQCRCLHDVLSTLLSNQNLPEREVASPILREALKASVGAKRSRSGTCGSVMGRWRDCCSP